MVDWVSLTISILTSSITFILAMISLIISWRTYRTRFKPYLSIVHHIVYPQHYLIAIVVTNIGNGAATDIRIKYQLKDKIENYYLPNLMTKENSNLVEGDLSLPGTTEITNIIAFYKDINGKQHSQNWNIDDIFVELEFVGS